MNKPIGIFDSGLGGLTAFKELYKLLPNEDIVYFGDIGRVPYGDKSFETIIKYSTQDVNFLNSLDVKMILIACGTISSLIENFKEKINVPFVEVINPTVAAAYNASRSKRIGIIGTSATIRSSSYKKQLEKIDASVKVFQKSCSLFVPFIENGFSSKNNIIDPVIKYYLEEIRDANVDTLILGCTHYPILSEPIQRFMGENVTLINSGREIALQAKNVLEQHKLQNQTSTSPKYKFFVSDNPDIFVSNAQTFLNKEIIKDISKVDIEQF